MKKPATHHAKRTPKAAPMETTPIANAPQDQRGADTPDVAPEPQDVFVPEPAPAPTVPTDPRDAKFAEAGVDAVREHLAMGRYADNRAERAKAWLARQ